jgi:hypothetical protein
LMSTDAGAVFRLPEQDRRFEIQAEHAYSQ